MRPVELTALDSFSIFERLLGITVHVARPSDSGRQQQPQRTRIIGLVDVHVPKTRNEKSLLAADETGGAQETFAGRSDGGNLVLLNDDVHVGQTNSPPDIDHSYIHDRN